MAAMVIEQAVSPSLKGLMMMFFSKSPSAKADHKNAKYFEEDFDVPAIITVTIFMLCWQSRLHNLSI